MIGESLVIQSENISHNAASSHLRVSTTFRLAYSLGKEAESKVDSHSSSSRGPRTTEKFLASRKYGQDPPEVSGPATWGLCHVSSQGTSVSSTCVSVHRHPFWSSSCVLAHKCPLWNSPCALAYRHPFRSSSPPPHSPSAAWPGRVEPPRTQPPPCPHAGTSAQMPAWQT